MVETRQVSVDSRRLTYEVAGPADGSPVLFLHGSPGSRLSNRPDDDWLSANNVRYVTYDRPGYGQSEPHPGRSIADCVPDVRTILDDAGISRAVVIGRSGGGPHALALAALLADRCSSAAALVPVAPKVAGLDWYAGMDAENIRRFRAAEGDPAQARADFEPDLAGIVARCATDPVTAWHPMVLPEVDVDLLALGGAKALVPLQEAARQGASGFADDFVALVRPWGFAAREVVAPVLLQFGRLDVNVPPSHTEWLIEQLPAGTTVLYDEAAGHAMHTDTYKQLVLRLTKLVSDETKNKPSGAAPDSGVRQYPRN